MYTSAEESLTDICRCTRKVSRQRLFYNARPHFLASSLQLPCKLPDNLCYHRTRDALLAALLHQHTKLSLVSIPVLGFVPVAILHSMVCWSFRRMTSVPA